MIFFIVFVIILAVLFLVINFLFAPHNPYQEKYSIFECGFHSFLGQNRSNFYVSFFIYGILYLIFDLEITLVFPYAVSSSENGPYGLVILALFIAIVTLGFCFELGKGALVMPHKQDYNLSRSINNRKVLINSIINNTWVFKFNNSSQSNSRGF